jgi:hypothetical protein
VTIVAFAIRAAADPATKANLKNDLDSRAITTRNTVIDGELGDILKSLLPHKSRRSSQPLLHQRRIVPISIVRQSHIAISPGRMQAPRIVPIARIRPVATCLLRPLRYALLINASAYILRSHEPISRHCFPVQREGTELIGEEDLRKSLIASSESDVRARSHVDA